MPGTQRHPPGLQLPVWHSSSSTTHPAPALGRCYGHPQASSQQPEDISSWGEPFVFKSPCVNLTLPWIHSLEYFKTPAWLPKNPEARGIATCLFTVGRALSWHLSNLPPASSSWCSLVSLFLCEEKEVSLLTFFLLLVFFLDVSQLFLSQPDPFQAMYLSEVIPDLSLSFFPFAVVCPLLLIFFQTSLRKKKKICLVCISDIFAAAFIWVTPNLIAIYYF